MPPARPRAVRDYSSKFKLTPVRMSHEPGVQVKTVAAAPEIHAFTLSKWRKDARQGPKPCRLLAQVGNVENRGR